MAQSDTKQTFPVRFFHPDPRTEMRILRPGKRVPMKFTQGVLQVTNTRDLAIARKALKGVAFEEDWPDDRPAPMCQHCGYAPRSFEAAQRHQSLHPVIS